MRPKEVMLHHHLKATASERGLSQGGEAKYKRRGPAQSQFARAGWQSAEAGGRSREEGGRENGFRPAAPRAVVH